MIRVLDASAVVELLLGTRRAGPVRTEARAPDASLHVPALCDVEIASALRRLLLNGILSETRAMAALEDYLDLPLTRHGHQTLLARILTLRANFSSYDATYVALAERLSSALVTGDQALARATEDHLDIPVVLAEEQG